MARGTELVGVMMRAALVGRRRGPERDDSIRQHLRQISTACVDHSSGRPDRLPIR